MHCPAAAIGIMSAPDAWIPTSTPEKGNLIIIVVMLLATEVTVDPELHVPV